MSLETVQQMVIEVLGDIQTISGRDLIPMSGSTCAIGELPGFDSLNGIEATLEISARLGYDLEVDNLLVDESGNRALTIREIAERACKVMDAMGVKK
ncbi:MAG: hypothetical protein WCV99_08285 [Sterolibacterium sp.]|jgi:hypothetical protein